MREKSTPSSLRFAGFTVIETVLAVTILGASLVAVQSNRQDDRTETEARHLANHLQVVGDAARKYWIYFGGGHMLNSIVEANGTLLYTSYTNAFYGNNNFDNVARNHLELISGSGWPLNLELLENRGFLNNSVEWLNTRWGSLSSSRVSGKNTWGRSGYVLTLNVTQGREDVARRAAGYLAMPHAFRVNPVTGALSLSVQFFTPMQAPLGSLYAYTLLARGQPHMMLGSIYANVQTVLGLPPGIDDFLPSNYYVDGVYILDNSTASTISYEGTIGDHGSQVTLVSPKTVLLNPTWQASSCAVNGIDCLEDQWMDPLDTGNYWHADIRLPGDAVFEAYTIITGGPHGITEHANVNASNKNAWLQTAAPVFVNDIEINILYLRWACMANNGSLNVNSFNRTCLHASTAGTRLNRLTTINDVSDRNWKFDPVNMGANRNWPEYEDREAEVTSDARLKTGFQLAPSQEFARAHAESRDLSSAGVAKVMRQLKIDRAANQTVTDAAILSTMWATAASIDGNLQSLNQDIDALLQQVQSTP